MLTIYHNPRCGKSREGLQLLKSLHRPVTVVKYIDTPPSADELKGIIKKLGIAPIDLVRTKKRSGKKNMPVNHLHLPRLSQLWLNTHN